MKMIRPTSVTDSILTSSSVAETEFSAWSSATTYSLDQQVIKSHRIYKSLQASNTNHDPALSPTWWLDVGPTNRWAMFDNAVGTSTTATGSITVTLAPGRVDSVALIGVDASTVVVEMTNGTTVYSKTVPMIDDSSVTDWYGYFFEPVRTKDYVVLTDLPVIGEASITVTISKSSGNVSCQALIVGMKSEIGGMLSSPSIGIVDYSRKSTDDFGVTTLVQRSFAKKLDCKLILDNSEVDRVVSALSSVRATPIIWVGSDRFSTMVVYGFFRDFSIDIAYARNSYCSLNIEGLT